MNVLRHLLKSLQWAVAGSLIVLAFMLLIDEQEYRTVGVAGACCGLLRLVFPSDVFAYLARRAWTALAGYLVVGYVWQLFELFAYLTGKSSIFGSRASMYTWNVVVFPSSLGAYVLGSLFGGNFGNFVWFAAPIVNATLLALVVGSVFRRRARAAHRGARTT